MNPQKGTPKYVSPLDRMIRASLRMKEQADRCTRLMQGTGFRMVHLLEALKETPYGLTEAEVILDMGEEQAKRIPAANMLWMKMREAKERDE